MQKGHTTRKVLHSLALLMMGLVVVFAWPVLAILSVPTASVVSQSVVAEAAGDCNGVMDVSTGDTAFLSGSLSLLGSGATTEIQKEVQAILAGTASSFGYKPLSDGAMTTEKVFAGLLYNLQEKASGITKPAEGTNSLNSLPYIWELYVWKFSHFTNPNPKEGNNTHVSYANDKYTLTQLGLDTYRQIKLDATKINQKYNDLCRIDKLITAPWTEYDNKKMVDFYASNHNDGSAYLQSVSPKTNGPLYIGCYHNLVNIDDCGAGTNGGNYVGKLKGDGMTLSTGANWSDSYTNIAEFAPAYLGLSHPTTTEVVGATMSQDFTDVMAAVKGQGEQYNTQKNVENSYKFSRCGVGPKATDFNIPEVLKFTACTAVEWIHGFGTSLLASAVGLLSESSGIGSSLAVKGDPLYSENTTFFSGMIPTELKSVNLVNNLVSASGTNPGGIGHVIVVANSYILGFVNFGVMILFIIIALANILQIQLKTYQLKAILPGLIIGFMVANFSLFFIRASLEVTAQLTESVFRLQITGQDNKDSLGSVIKSDSTSTYMTGPGKVDVSAILARGGEGATVVQQNQNIQDAYAAVAKSTSDYCKQNYDLVCFVNYISMVGGNPFVPFYTVEKGPGGNAWAFWGYALLGVAGGAAAIIFTGGLALAGLAVGAGGIWGAISQNPANIVTSVNWNLVVQQGILNIFIVAAAVMLLILAFLFVLRAIVFYFLTPLAPLAVMGMFLPQFKSMADKWWKTFTGWLFMPLVATFWIWLGFMWVRALGDVLTSGIGESYLVPPISAFISYAFALFCIYMAMKTPFSMAGEARELVNKWNGLGKKAWGSTGGALGKTAKGEMKAFALGRTPIGTIKNRLSSIKTARDNRWKEAELGPGARAKAKKEERISALNAESGEYDRDLATYTELSNNGVKNDEEKRKLAFLENKYNWKNPTEAKEMVEARKVQINQRVERLRRQRKSWSEKMDEGNAINVKKSEEDLKAVEAAKSSIKASAELSLIDPNNPMHDPSYMARQDARKTLELDAKVDGGSFRSLEEVNFANAGGNAAEAQRRTEKLATAKARTSAADSATEYQEEEGALHYAFTTPPPDATASKYERDQHDSRLRSYNKIIQEKVSKRDEQSISGMTDTALHEQIASIIQTGGTFDPIDLSKQFGFTNAMADVIYLHRTVMKDNNPSAVQDAAKKLKDITKEKDYQLFEGRNTQGGINLARANLRKNIPDFVNKLDAFVSRPVNSTMAKKP